MIPLKLLPACKDYLWGGTLLKTKYNKKSDLERLAETWELSCHKDGESIIENGSFAGRTLSEYIKQMGPAVLGRRCERFAEFPIMIKLIDAKENLSVQVHPDDAYAQRVEGGYGKTEMWYILECEEGASLIYGFQHPISREEFAERIRNNTLLEVVNQVPVKKGDVFFIEAGTLHAIGQGIVLAEVQQSSNLTYRVYDYGRLGPDNKPRQLHIEKALDVTRLAPATRKTGPQGDRVKMDGYYSTLLADCQYLHTELIEVYDRAGFNADNESFISIICLEGCSEIISKTGNIAIAAGDSVFLPAGMGEFTVGKPCKLLYTNV